MDALNRPHNMKSDYDLTPAFIAVTRWRHPINSVYILAWVSLN